MFHAGGIAIRNRLMGSGMDQATADRWSDDWEDRGDRTRVVPIRRLLAGRLGLDRQGERTAPTGLVAV
jgi:hypothetical protein